MRKLLVSALIAAAAPVLTGGSLAIAAPTQVDAGQEIVDLSRQQWQWMADGRIDLLEPLFHEKARFVHMGATMTKGQELDVIRSGKIRYKQATISEISAEMIGNSAIVYSKIQLIAVVGGNEVTNPFAVTQVYVRNGRKWQLASMAFTRLLGE